MVRRPGNAEPQGYGMVKHQGFVGAGYFGEITTKKSAKKKQARPVKRGGYDKPEESPQRRNPDRAHDKHTK